jgi:hypothetical protein
MPFMNLSKTSTIGCFSVTLKQRRMMPHCGIWPQEEFGINPGPRAIAAGTSKKIFGRAQHCEHRSGDRSDLSVELRHAPFVKCAQTRKTYFFKRKKEIEARSREQSTM